MVKPVWARVCVKRAAPPSFSSLSPCREQTWSLSLARFPSRFVFPLTHLLFYSFHCNPAPPSPSPTLVFLSFLRLSPFDATLHCNGALASRGQDLNSLYRLLFFLLFFFICPLCSSSRSLDHNFCLSCTYLILGISFTCSKGTNCSLSLAHSSTNISFSFSSFTNMFVFSTKSRLQTIFNKNQLN